MSNTEAAEWIVGCKLTAQTQFEEIHGEVFAYDKGSNTLLLRQQGWTPSQSHLRLLKASLIKVRWPVALPVGRRYSHNIDLEQHACGYLQSVRDVSPAAHAAGPLPQVDMQRCRDREVKALQVARFRAVVLPISLSLSL